MSLNANTLLYESYLTATKRAVRRHRAAACPLIERTATYAWQRHPGRFADGALENLLVGLAQNLPAADVAPIPRIDASREMTLHVASEVYSTGGHSRVLTKWMQEDKGSQHALVITRQTQPLPDFLMDRWSSIGVTPVMLDPTSPHDARAASLRALSRSATRIVLHQHPDDVIPVLAYAADKTVPVIMFNHAHFWFSFGTTVADLVANIWPYYGMLALTRRAARRVEYLDLTGIAGLERLGTEPVNKAAAKLALGLPPGEPVAMTLGHERYYVPIDGLNFFQMAAKLMRNQPRLQLLFVAVPPEFEHIPAELRNNPRVQFLGKQSDPLPFYRAADLFLESFPTPSLGATGEAFSYGEAYPVLSFSDSETIMRPTIASLPTRPRSESEWFSQIEYLLSDLEKTHSAARDMRRLAARLEASFEERINHLYRVVASVGMDVKAIPAMLACNSLDDQIMANVATYDLPLTECAKFLPGKLPWLLYLSRAATSRHVTFRQYLKALRAGK